MLVLPEIREAETSEAGRRGEVLTATSDRLIKSGEMFTSSLSSARLKETYLIITALITAGTITEIGCKETAAKIRLAPPPAAGLLWVNRVSFH